MAIVKTTGELPSIALMSVKRFGSNAFEAERIEKGHNGNKGLI